LLSSEILDEANLLNVVQNEKLISNDKANHFHFLSKDNLLQDIQKQ